MELEKFYGINYKGSRRLTQRDVSSGSAAGPGAKAEQDRCDADGYAGDPNMEDRNEEAERYAATGSYAGDGYMAPDYAMDEYMERGVDLNEQLVRNRPATFFMRVSGDAMIGAGIFNGDVVIVDRSVKAVSGKVVIASLNGELLIRRLEKTFNKIRLVPETTRLSPIDVDISGAEFSVWGVVTYVIHSL